MMVLKADDCCNATVHKGLQTLVVISCMWESIQKKLVCRRKKSNRPISWP